MFWSYIFCLSKMCVRKGCPFQQDYRRVLEAWPMTTSWSRPLTSLPKSPRLPRRSRSHMTRSLRNCRRPRKEDRYQSPNAVGLERNLSPCHPSQFAFLKCMPHCNTCTTLLHEFCYALIAQVKRYTGTNRTEKSQDTFFIVWFCLLVYVDFITWFCFNVMPYPYHQVLTGTCNHWNAEKSSF